MRRILSMILALVILVSCVPIWSYADSPAEEVSAEAAPLQTVSSEQSNHTENTNQNPVQQDPDDGKAAQPNEAPSENQEADQGESPDSSVNSEQKPEKAEQPEKKEDEAASSAEDEDDQDEEEQKPEEGEKSPESSDKDDKHSETPENGEPKPEIFENDQSKPEDPDSVDPKTENPGEDDKGSQIPEQPKDPEDEPPHVHTGSLVPEVPATEQSEGKRAYYVCSCGKYFADAGCTAEIGAIGSWGILPRLQHQHDLSQVSGRKSTCTEPGIRQHWHCSGCGKNFADAQAAAELADVTLPLAAHKAMVIYFFYPVKGQYWHCNVCGSNFADAGCTQMITNLEEWKKQYGKHVHQMTEVPGREPDCQTEGVLHHWHCSGCGKNFADPAGSQEISNVVLPKTDHIWSENVQYIWGENNRSCRAIRSCTRYPEHTMEARAIVTVDNDVPAKGQQTFTAIFNPDWAKTQVKVVGEPDIPEPTDPTDPTEPEPTDPEPTDPEPTEPEPTDPEPTEPEPTDPEPTDPEPTEPEPTEPEPTEPEPTEPQPTDPEPTEPEPTDPEPTEPEPTEPEPTEPEPTEPKPTEPKPTEPEPTEPDPTVPVDSNPVKPKPQPKPEKPTELQEKPAEPVETVPKEEAQPDPAEPALPAPPETDGMDMTPGETEFTVEVAPAGDGEAMEAVMNLESLEQIRQSIASGDTERGMAIRCGDMALCYDLQALDAILEQAEGAESVSFSLEQERDPSNLTEAQARSVSEKQKSKVYSVDLTLAGGGRSWQVHDFAGGRSTITVPCTKDRAHLMAAYRVEEDGSLTELECLYDGKSQTATFVTPSHSHYMVVPVLDVHIFAWIISSAMMLAAIYVMYQNRKGYLLYLF